MTRDRIYADCTWLSHSFTLIDTGGIEPDSSDIILAQMREQAQIAIDTADVIIFIVDVRQGLVDSDSKVADMLRKSRKPVVLAVNKVDSFEKFGNDVYEFYNLGIGDPVPVSAASRLGLGELLDEVAKHFTPDQYDDEEDDRPRVAIVGKPNVGKSSIINKMLGENRVIVSDIAGTTRDAVDTEVIHNGTEYVFIDTAGLRRKSKVKEDIERYSIIRTVTAVDRADVVLMVIDATQGVTEQDAKIAGIAHDRGKGIIVVVNKWDAIEKTDKTIYEYTNKLKETLAYMPYAEYVFVSALTGQRMQKLFDLIDMVRENQTLRVATGVLNEIVTEAVAMQQPPSDKGKRLKIYYVTQVSVKPPTFVVFVNDKELMHFSYTRYLENKIREAFGFPGHILKIHHPGTEGKGVDHGKDLMSSDGVCVRPVSDRISLWKNAPYRYQTVWQRQFRHHQCAAGHGEKGGPPGIYGRLPEDGFAAAGAAGDEGRPQRGPVRPLCGPGGGPWPQFPLLSAF